MNKKKVTKKQTKEERLSADLAACKRFVAACGEMHAERRPIPNGISWQDGDALLSVTVTPGAELEFAYARALDMNECQIDMNTYHMIATGVSTKEGMKINIYAVTEEAAHKHYFFCCTRRVPPQYAKRSLRKFNDDADRQYRNLLANEPVNHAHGG